jgi:GNAT superfamily N-acetyltransferase
LDVRAVDEQLWPDLERLFEGTGGPKSCWCMVWRATPDEAKHADGPSRKRALERRVRSGIPIGLLGYVDGQPVAWCSVAPRSTYRRLGQTSYQGIDEEDIWSIVCFFVSRPARGSGISRQLLDAAVDHATRAGAKVVEGYPVDPDSPSYRFMGFVPLFEQAAFTEVARAGSRRHVVSLWTGQAQRE